MDLVVGFWCFFCREEGKDSAVLEYSTVDCLTYKTELQTLFATSLTCHSNLFLLDLN